MAEPPACCVRRTGGSERKERYMTAAALHELTEIRRRLVQLRAAVFADHQQIDDLVTVVSRMEDAALNSEVVAEPDEVAYRAAEDAMEKRRAGL